MAVLLLLLLVSDSDLDTFDLLTFFTLLFLLLQLEGLTASESLPSMGWERGGALLLAADGVDSDEDR